MVYLVAWFIALALADVALSEIGLRYYPENITEGNELYYTMGPWWFFAIKAFDALLLAVAGLVNAFIAFALKDMKLSLFAAAGLGIIKIAGFIFVGYYTLVSFLVVAHNVVVLLFYYQP